MGYREKHGRPINRPHRRQVSVLCGWGVPHPRATARAGTMARATARYASTQPPGRPQGSHPLVLTTPALTKTRNSSSFFVVFVRAGVAWSGVGTLAVALGWGCGCLA